jgi:hypothetical protein
LKPLTCDLEQHLKHPCFLPARKLPDLPHPALCVRSVVILLWRVGAR